MSKRLFTIPLINRGGASSVKRAKLSEPLPVHHADTVTESMSPSNNYNPGDSSNEFSSESENEGHTFSALSDKAKRKPKCKSKNAIMARINRIKKKNYIEGLELKTSQLEAENKTLRGDLNQKVGEIAALKREVLNLKNVIRNRTEIGTLLKCIHQNTNLKITSSLLGNSVQNSSEAAQPGVATNNAKNTLKSPSTSMPTFSNSDEEGKHVYSNPNHSPSSLINDNPVVGSAILSPKEILDEFNFDHDAQFDHGYFADLETKVSRFDIQSPDCSLAEFDSESDDFNRCETPSKCANSISESSYFADEDLGFNLGVCLHVANNQVSIEFCDSCNHKAILENQNCN